MQCRPLKSSTCDVACQPCWKDCFRIKIHWGVNKTQRLLIENNDYYIIFFVPDFHFLPSSVFASSQPLFISHILRGRLFPDPMRCSQQSFRVFFPKDIYIIFFSGVSSDQAICQLSHTPYLLPLKQTVKWMNSDDVVYPGDVECPLPLLTHSFFCAKIVNHLCPTVCHRHQIS